MRRISALVVLFAASSVYADPPPTDRIVIDVITVNGTGCPANIAAVSVSPDNTEFTFTHSDYTAQVGVGTRPTDFRKTCNLNLLVHIPLGFTYGIASVTYHGFALFEAGATGLARGTFFFQGQTQRPFLERRFSGPFSDEWELTGGATNILAPLPCGQSRNLNINTELQVNVGTSDPTTTTSFVTMDSADVYRFEWKQCP